jgi:hypothetical protein
VKFTAAASSNPCSNARRNSMASALGNGIRNRHRNARNVKITVRSCTAVTSSHRAAVGPVTAFLYVAGFLYAMHVYGWLQRKKGACCLQGHQQLHVLGSSNVKRRLFRFWTAEASASCMRTASSRSSSSSSYSDSMRLS